MLIVILRRATSDSSPFCLRRFTDPLPKNCNLPFTALHHMDPTHLSRTIFGLRYKATRNLFQVLEDSGLFFSSRKGTVPVLPLHEPFFSLPLLDQLLPTHQSRLRRDFFRSRTGTRGRRPAHALPRALVIFGFFLIALVRQFCDPVSWVLGAVLLVVADSESAHFRVLTNSCEHVPTF